MRPTQKEVADLAGVSKATVSYVINDKKGGNIRISQETREKVWDAVKQLGYSVNASARSLRTRKTNLISVMVPDLVNPVFPKLVRAIQNSALEEGYTLLVFDSNKSVELENAFYKAMRSRQVDGVLLVNFRVPQDEVVAMVNSGVHVMTSTLGLQAPGVSYCWVDDFKVGEMATQYLLDQGHTRIAHISWSLEFSPNILRLDGYQKVMEESVGYDESLVFEIHRDTDAVSQVLKDLFRMDDPPTAIFAGTDMVGIEVIKVAKRMGLSIPGDLAVIGVDNIPETTVIEPTMSTIDIQPKVIGEKMVKCILSKMDQKAGECETEELVISPKLVDREST